MHVLFLFFLHQTSKHTKVRTDVSFKGVNTIVKEVLKTNIKSDFKELEGVFVNTAHSNIT